MKLEDAPPPGWYPDPDRFHSLRWWEGTDWSDARRVPPSTTELAYQAREANEASLPTKGSREQYVPPGLRSDRRDADEIVTQVRKVAREEVQRAADLFSQRSTNALRSLQRVIGGYVGTFLRWFRIALFVGALLVIAWFVLQLFVQASLFNWLGDRIDSFTD